MSSADGRSRLNRLAIAAAIVFWTAIAWGGRIGLLADGDSPWAWARISGSLVIGLVSAVALIWGGDRSWALLATGSFALWTFALWSRSLLVNWLGDGSLPFKLVHTALALGFFGLAVLAWRAGRTGTI